MSYTLQRILSELLLPPFGPCIVMFIACLIAVRRPRLGIALSATCLLLQLGLGLASLNLVLRKVPTPPARIEPPYPAADAIVVLGGGRYFNTPEYAGDTAGPSTLERVRYAAKLHRETGLPILVSGGRPGDSGTRAEAEIMRDILRDEFNVPVRWVEDRSEQTPENARFSAELLKRDGVQRILLVTHGDHMPRAKAAFQESGLVVVPMITGFPQPENVNIWGLTPSFYGLSINRAALYEWLARFKP